VGASTLPDAKRSQPISGNSSQKDDDPRAAYARQYLEKAAAALAEEEAAKPRRERRTNRGGSGKTFSLSVAPSAFVHVVLASLAMTFAALCVLWCFHLLTINFVAGRVVAVPTGIVVAATLGYVSVLFLGFIESTSTGHTDVDALQGDWQDWFWTLPSTLGIVAFTAFIGWLISLAVPANVWLVIGWCILLLYPVLQLSSMEAGVPFVAFSLPVLRSVAKSSVAWIIFYAISLTVANVLWGITRAAWRDPPYPTVLVMGPVVGVALFVYAWMLGQLALIIGSQKETS
jgi:hypothetical protein